MEAYDLADLRAARAASGRLYHEFIRTHDLSVGVYVLPAGGTDSQRPHTEDEVYYFLNGRAALVVEGSRTDVGRGSVAFVAAGDDHRFVDITEDLEVFVFWSPARHSNEPAAG